MNNSNQLDTSEQIPALQEVLDLFQACYDRAFQQVQGLPFPKPDSEKDIPINLAIYTEAIQTFDLDVSELQKYIDSLINFIDQADSAKLAKKFPSAEQYCLNIIPIKRSGEPAAEIHLSKVSARGLTYGPVSDPAYLFLNYPQEIQTQCSFICPAQKFPGIISITERQEIKKSVLTVWDNLIQLLQLKPKS